MAIRLGLIARSEVARGIALQSRNFYDHMPVDDVLLVRMPRPDCKEAPEWYPGATHAAYDPIRHQLDEELVTDWLEGLDVVFTVETPNDWRMPLWCREMGVKLVIQGNPEFVRHGREGFEHLAHPDQWWWPTKWRTDILPTGVHMPVPMPDTVPVERDDADVPLRVLHVVGKRAYADRNGTEILVSALRRVRRKMHVTIIGLDGELPKVQAGPSNRNLTVEYHPDGFDNHWDMYRNQDVLVIPRRYGGLCLERSTPVQRNWGPPIPIDEVSIGDWLRDGDGFTQVTARRDRTVEESVSISARGKTLTSSVDHLHMVADTPDRAHLSETRAEDVRPGQWAFVARPESEGWMSVHLGPKPARKGLKNWKESIHLDAGWARIIGTWLAEGHGGWYDRKGRDRPMCELTWSFGARDAHLAHEVVRLLAERGVRATTFEASSSGSYGPSTIQKVRCRSELLGQLFDVLGLGLRAGAAGKRAPDLHASLVPALIGGWLDGDGSESNGSITGWSRSIGMIDDLWRLAAKVGVCGSITHGGERLDFNADADVAVVAGWCHRVTTQRVRTRATKGDARPVEGGWMVRIKKVTRRAEPCDVVAIETTSGTYVANDILTHNCLPALEAAACGLAVMMPDCSPNAELASVLVPVRRAATLSLAAGTIRTAEVAPLDLSEHLDRLAWDRNSLIQAKDTSQALVPRWSMWRQRYLDRLQEVVSR